MNNTGDKFESILIWYSFGNDRFDLRINRYPLKDR